MIYVLLADGFEEMEALSPVDLLRRANCDVRTVGVTGAHITGAHGITVKADIGMEDVDTDKMEMLVLPGGMGYVKLQASAAVQTLLDKAKLLDVPVAAICAAPSILGERGELTGKNAVCFPGFENNCTGADLLAVGAVRDGRIITGRAAGAAVPFGLLLVEVLCGKERAESLAREICYDRA